MGRNARRRIRQNQRRRHSDLPVAIRVMDVEICPKCDHPADECYVMVCSDPHCGQREICCSRCAGSYGQRVLENRHHWRLVA